MAALSSYRLTPLIPLICFCMSGHVNACDIGAFPKIGFVYEDIPSFAGNHQILHLPKNAKGVLIYPWGGEDYLKKAVSILDEKTNQKIKPSIKHVGMASAPEQLMFRVEPQGGFTAGRTYKFIYNSFLSVTYEIEVYIDDFVLPSSLGGFSLEPQSPIEKELLQIPMQGSCTDKKPVISQKVKYLIPDTYLKYRDILLFFTYASTKSDEKSFSPYAYSDSMAHDVPFGRSMVGVGNELLYQTCQNDANQSQIEYVQGYVGFLEVEDEPHKVGPIKINFGEARSKLCKE